MSIRRLPAFAVAALFALPLAAQPARCATNLTVDGSQTFQTITGMGVNVNVNSWNGGQLAPALDLLIRPAGATNTAPTFRLIRDPMTWVSDEADIAPLHALDPATLTRIYEAPAMQDIWNTVAYMNSKGVRGRQLTLNFQGWTPVWLGGSGAFNVASHITPGKEAELATMIASLVYYGRVVKGLDFSLLGPLNESDWNCLEGPCVAAGQYATVLHAIVAELDAFGLTDIRLVGPDTADLNNADAYVTAMMADSSVAARTLHLGLHHYGAPSAARQPYPGHDYWLSETAGSCPTCDLSGAPSQGEWAFASQSGEVMLGSLVQGISGIQIWDGYDGFYYVHNAVGTFGLLAYNATTGIYTPRKRYFVDAQVYGFISPGAVRIGESDAISTLGSSPAFYDSATGRVTIIGQNTGTTPITVTGQLNNLPGSGTFELFTTDAGAASLTRGADVPIVGGAFTVTIPAATVFTLASNRDTVPPLISAISVSASPNRTARVTWSTDELANSRVDYGTSPDSMNSSASDASLQLAHGVTLTSLLPLTTYSFRITSVDPSGNGATAPVLPDPPLTFTTPETLVETPPVAVATGTPQSGVAPLTVSFSGALSTDADNDSLAFSWTFGDGGTATGRLASHVYAAAGNYAAILTVNDNRGGIDTASVAITATPPPPPPPFPVTAVLDNFNRANGAVGANWIDQASLFTISGNTLAFPTGDDYMEWNPTVFGANQEAFVTLTTASATASEQNLMLKTQGTKWSAGHIEVSYSAPTSKVTIYTFSPPSTWKTAGTISGVSFAAGNQFGARAQSDGSVLVYKNGVQVGAASVAGWAYASLGGRIGLSCSKATGTRVDDFGGGNSVAVNTPPVASIALPANNSFYYSGQTINLSGSATDNQTASNLLTYNWVVDLIFGGHTQPAYQTFAGATASYAGANVDDGTGVHQLIKLTATDPQGLPSATVTSTIWPEIDLMPSAVTVTPDPPIAGQSAHYAFGLSNTGRMPAQASHWVLRAGGTVLAQGDAAVPASGSVSLAADATLPASGTFALRLVADSLATLFETNEANNAVTRGLTVVPANRPPVAVATGAPQSGAAPLTVNFSGALSTDADNDSLTFGWTFGDGGTATGRLASHVYAAAGSYAAILTVNDNRGGIDTASVAISATTPVNTAPVASIALPANNSFYVTGQTIDLSGSAHDAQTPPDSLTYNWVVDLIFGGHTQPAYQSFTDTTASYLGANVDDGTGVHQLIKLTATDPQGLPSAPVTSTIWPEIDLTPSAVTVTPDPPIAGQNAHYTFVLSNTGRMPAQPSHWVLRAGSTVLAQGDAAVPASGSVSLAADATLPASGTFALRLVADSLAGVFETNEANNAIARSLTVNAPPGNHPPVAVATGTPQSGVAPLTVSFSGALSTDADNDSLAFSWTFGDGGTATGRLASHVYAAAGNYAAILTVNDNRGGIDTASVALTATAPPPPPPFPATAVLDNFNRANGAVGANWIDQASLFTISGNTLAFPTGDDYMEWNPTVFGANQEAFVTLTTASATAGEQNLMLKTQGTKWSAGHIEVCYTAPTSKVTIYTFTPPSTWKTAGTITGVSFAAGNQFGARAQSNGTVQVFKNGVQVGAASVAGWAYAALGGRIGLSCSKATGTRVDDFGGGNVALAALAPLAAPPLRASQDPVAPGSIALSSAFPNPTTGAVSFTVTLPSENQVSVHILDLQGREVWREPARRYGAGRWTLGWDGRSPQGGPGAGLYFACVRVGTQQFLRRIALIR